MTDPVNVIRDEMDPTRAQALRAALGLDVSAKKGAPLSPFFHRLYFWSPQPPENLGRDGHPKTGGVIPDMGLPRRMWAGGRMAFYNPLVSGRTAEKRTFVEKTAHKEGRTGPLGFVTMRHEIYQGGQACVTEWQDLVYREDPDPAAPKPAPVEARTDEDHFEVAEFDSTLLFRYSALTFNGHRIHYDIDYAKDVEGYNGLVVHGPLLAQLLMLLAERKLGSLSAFSFRATAPLTHLETADLCWKAGNAWVRAPDGRQNMIAQATA